MIEEIKVSELPEASQINDNDLIMIVQNGTNKKITKENCQFASGDEVAISTTEPSEDEKLWINPNDTPSGTLNPITNTYSVAADKAYSCNYMNNSLEPCKTIVFDNEWLFAFYPRGMGLNIIIPMYNPEQKSVSVNLSNKEIFTGSQWVTLGNHQVNAVFPTFLILGFDTTGLGLDEGDSWLIRIKGTISVND